MEAALLNSRVPFSALPALPYKQPPRHRKRFPQGTPAHVKEVQRRNRNRDAAADLRERKRQYETVLTGRLQEIQNSISDLEKQEVELLRQENELHKRLAKANGQRAQLDSLNHEQTSQVNRCGSDAIHEYVGGVNEIDATKQAFYGQQKNCTGVDSSIETADSNRPSQQTSIHSHVGMLLMLWAVMAHCSSPCLSLTSMNQNIINSPPSLEGSHATTPILEQTVHQNRIDNRNQLHHPTLPPSVMIPPLPLPMPIEYLHQPRHQSSLAVQ